MDDPDRDPALAPETINNEQEDEETQAQTIAEEALLRRGTNLGLGDTEKVPTGDETADSAQDLVDHMRQMERSGRIDLSAFEGEPNHDDDDDAMGKQANGGWGTDPDEDGDDFSAFGEPDPG